MFGTRNSIYPQTPQTAAATRARAHTYRIESALLEVKIIEPSEMDGKILRKYAKHEKTKNFRCFANFCHRIWHYIGLHLTTQNDIKQSHKWQHYTIFCRFLLFILIPTLTTTGAHHTLTNIKSINACKNCPL